MAHKRRIHPLREYRAVQREIRALFDPFTQKYCPTCAAPCCVQPTRVTPLDVALAESVGHTFPHLQSDHAAAPAMRDAAHRLSSSALSLPVVNEDAPTFCEYLDKGRCTFPDDLRPFGCTTYLCSPMYANLPPETIKRLRRLVRHLEDAHTALLRVLKESG